MNDIEITEETLTKAVKVLNQILATEEKRVLQRTEPLSSNELQEIESYTSDVEDLTCFLQEELTSWNKHIPITINEYIFISNFLDAYLQSPGNGQNDETEIKSHAYKVKKYIDNFLQYQ